MAMSYSLVVTVIGLLSSCMIASGLSWNSTEYMFVFGDSYSTDGYNISAGMMSPYTSNTSSNGLNWVEYLTGTYNQTSMRAFNLASGGCTTDAALVPPFIPTSSSVVEQVAQFSEYMASKPVGATWNSTNSLFAIWIGINDISGSYAWSNVSQPEFYGVVVDRLFSQVDDLYSMGARSFLFLTVPPINRAPLNIQRGSEVAAKIATDIAEYNTHIRQFARAFKANYTDLDTAIVFDTQPIFNALLDECETFGFVNVTGYCAAYAGGTPTLTYQVEGCAPASSYFWLNSLHPLFTVHNILAKAISNTLSGYGCPI